MIKRDAEKKIRVFSKQFRALAIVGPRQSGKTTLAKMMFPKKGKYKLSIQQAVRQTGKIKGVEKLDGITEIGFRIESLEKK